ncbi:hypothetical protein SISNIDRAFT_493879, partial [Sistotremastrum niveocremeum HHB9708]
MMETQTTAGSTQGSTPPVSQNNQKKESIEETLSKPFTPLDPDAITQKYDNDYQLGASFEADLTLRLLELIAATRVWANSRPNIETERHGNQLVDEIKGVQSAEAEQDRLRQRLLQFVQHIKSALAALTS